jgi:hypothetical protein
MKTVTYKITAKGRVWFKGKLSISTGKEHQIEINNESKDFQIGQTYTFTARVKTESTKYGSTTKVFPATESEQDISEIVRWLGYVEAHAATEGYLYKKGVDKLKEFEISKYQEYYDRLKKAVKLTEVTSALQRGRRYLGYIGQNLDRYWYTKGEDTVQQSIRELEKLGRADHASEIAERLSELKSKRANIKIKYAEDKHLGRLSGYTGKTYNLSGGSGYGCWGWHKGQIVHNNKKAIENGEPVYLYIIYAHAEYFREDGMSLGVGDDSGYLYSAIAREATVDESIPLRAEEAERQEISDAYKALRQISEQIQKTGERPSGTFRLSGPEYDFTSNPDARIYGAGEWFIVDEEFIWYVQSNGMDGDDWSRNNIRTGGAGAIGWRIPYEKTIADEIIRNHFVLKR